MERERTYLLPFSTPEEKERILDVIAHHNTERTYTDEYVRYGPDEAVSYTHLTLPTKFVV